MTARDGTTKQRRAEQRAARRQREEAAVRRRRRQRWLWWGGGGAAAAAVVGVGVFAIAANRASAAPTISGVHCNTSEGVATHTHQRLTIYDAGKPIPVPQGIGVDEGRNCLFWVHTHSPDGVIHVESPNQDTYTLGQFFDIWGQPLGRTRLLSHAANKVHGIRAYVNGRPYADDPRSILLAQHTLITLEYGPPWVAPTTRFAWPQGT
jgi:hypothetical protein